MQWMLCKTSPLYCQRGAHEDVPILPSQKMSSMSSRPKKAYPQCKRKANEHVWFMSTAIICWFLWHLKKTIHRHSDCLFGGHCHPTSISAKRSATGFTLHNFQPSVRLYFYSCVASKGPLSALTGAARWFCPSPIFSAVLAPRVQFQPQQALLSGFVQIGDSITHIYIFIKVICYNCWCHHLFCLHWG